MEKLITELEAILNLQPFLVRGELRKYIEKLKRIKEEHEAKKV